MGQKRRTFTAEQKAEVVRRHLKGKEAVSDLADELNVQPSRIHQWVATALAQMEQAFVGTGGRRKSSARLEDAKERQIKRLEEKLQLKNEVISELMEENVKAKKENGEL
jgi:transposase-like protein